MNDHVLKAGWDDEAGAVRTWCSCGAHIDFNAIDWTLPEAYEAHLRAVRKAEHEHL